jgi:hypothetical protein
VWEANSQIPPAATMLPTGGAPRATSPPGAGDETRAIPSHTAYQPYARIAYAIAAS